MQDSAIMESVSVPGSISGSSIVRDLLNRIKDKLSRDCSLRPIDVYSGYSYRVTVELQLADVYSTTVATEVAVGRIDPRLPVTRVDLGSNVLIAASDQPNLERPVVTPPEPPIDAPVQKPAVEPEPGVVSAVSKSK